MGCGGSVAALAAWSDLGCCCCCPPQPHPHPHPHLTRCTLLAALATDAAARERAVDQGAPRRVSHAMRMHAAQTSLQQHGCNALANLAAMAAPSRAHAKALADARTAAALAGAMRAHMKNVPLLEQARCRARVGGRATARGKVRARVAWG